MLIAGFWFRFVDTGNSERSHWATKALKGNWARLGRDN